jgi:hypothetical protein
MKTSKTTLILSLLASSFSFAADCTPIADATHKAVTAKPEAVLEIVAKDVAASPKCACPIIKAAVNASSADEALKGDIIAAALGAAPDEAAAIKACLPAKAYGKGGKNPVASGKEVVAGKGVVAKDPGPGEQDDVNDWVWWGFGGFGGGSNGVYLNGFSTGGGGRLVRDGDGSDQVTTVIRGQRPPRIVRVPTDGTNSK